MEGDCYSTGEDWNFLLNFPPNLEENLSFQPHVAQQPSVWQAPQQDLMVEKIQPESGPNQEKKDTEHFQKVRERKERIIKDVELVVKETEFVSLSHLV